jgi:hypothetical protein
VDGTASASAAARRMARTGAGIAARVTLARHGDRKGVSVRSNRRRART